MNYLRGAVSAISAPYSYYKEINPSTLTGAIDVIVVQGPSEDGSTTLSCSPFHVRFGKWQVLRPSEKKVAVSVNGRPIPFDMKIGEAGEAFFVFETDDDVPDDLVTSPLLQPSSPSDEAQGVSDDQSAVPNNRFGASPEDEPPTFLDLNSDTPYDEKASLDTEKSSFPEEERLQSPNDPVMNEDPSSSLEAEQDRRVDEALRRAGAEVHVPDVDYRRTIALDSDGYHSRTFPSRHGKEESEETVTGSPHLGPSHSVPFPSSNADQQISFPRASSEPPLAEDDLEYPLTPKPSSKGLGLSIPIQQEYMWDWGAFPQPSPMKTSFPGGLPWPKPPSHHHLASSLVEEQDEDELHIPLTERLSAWNEPQRSSSVPPGADSGSPTFARRSLPGSNEPATSQPLRSATQPGGYGAGGILSASKSDECLFVLKIEGKRITFEVAIVLEPRSPEELKKLFDGHQELEAALIFNKSRVTVERFLTDEDVVTADGLVVRWNENSYLTTVDNSPILDALKLWRQATILHHLNRSAALSPDFLNKSPSAISSPRYLSPSPSRPSSPVMSDDEEDRKTDTTPPTSADESDEVRQKPKPKPTSSSWVRWWSRSKKETTAPTPNLESIASDSVLEGSILKSGSIIRPEPRAADSAPALPSTPVSEAPPIVSHPADLSGDGKPQKRYAKTLRLTSDQLKSLNLHPGANTITFSLSATGTIACTARIFVWDSTDLILISDIDGTITKSDGLGHVFAMIGRDWTHLGVAKLYTDITKNGYKIMYLTSRAIGQADATRGYLKGIEQGGYQLPEGPVIMSPDRLMASLHREVIMRKPEVFKMACLRDIQRLFGQGKKPFYAGFGNRITDALSYRTVNVPSSRIFTIDSTGEVKLELLELAGYKSSYIHMTDLVDQMFPPIHRKWAPEYTDFNYWKPPVQEFALPDLSPPSPALSARSDTSNQSTLARIRNFSLVSSSPRPVGIPTSSRAASPERGDSPSSTSWSSASSLSIADGEILGTELRRQYRRERATSITSITSIMGGVEEEEEGLLDQLGKNTMEGQNVGRGDDDGLFEFDHEDESTGDLEEEDDLEGHDEDEDDQFDEDLLAVGEMKNVGFL